LNSVAELARAAVEVKDIDDAVTGYHPDLIPLRIYGNFADKAKPPPPLAVAAACVMPAADLLIKGSFELAVLQQIGDKAPRILFVRDQPPILTVGMADRMQLFGELLPNIGLFVVFLQGAQATPLAHVD
jgi:hypothetical protein